MSCLASKGSSGFESSPVWLRCSWSSVRSIGERGASGNGERGASGNGEGWLLTGDTASVAILEGGF